MQRQGVRAVHEVRVRAPHAKMRTCSLPCATYETSAEGEPVARARNGPGLPIWIFCASSAGGLRGGRVDGEPEGPLGDERVSCSRVWLRLGVPLLVVGAVMFGLLSAASDARPISGGVLRRLSRSGPLSAAVCRSRDECVAPRARFFEP